MNWPYDQGSHIRLQKRLADETLYLRGIVGTPEGRRMIRADLAGHMRDAESIGSEVARRLLDDGAGEILAQVYADH